ncbi:histidine phosphatase family protein [Oceanicella sp. SM1341]|uniref:histidine phosphatase family protein n=1 Tax=Oceanicella sp. SM1341 TaxID=1548889 RepID=UPI0035124BF7
MRFWWLRHGPTGAARAVGHTDLPASFPDEAALVRLRAALPQGAVLVSSDLTRARQTAERLGAFPLRLPDTSALRELDFGRWENRAFDEIERAEPEAARAFWTRPGPTPAPGGESWDALMARVSAAIAALEAAAPGADLVLVSHAGPIRAALALALGLGPEQAFAFRIDPLSLTRIDRLGSAWAVERVNARP